MKKCWRDQNVTCSCAMWQRLPSGAESTTGSSPSGREGQAMTREGLAWSYCHSARGKSQNPVPCANAVTVPLAEQQCRLEAVLAEGPTPLWRWAADNWPTICAAARARLRQGFRSYGDQMYHWDASERNRNMVEEIADWLCYKSSEETNE